MKSACLIVLACLLGFASSFTNAPSSFLRGAAVKASSSRRTAIGEGGHGIAFAPLDGSPLRIGIIRTRWNTVAVNSLLSGTKAALKESGVKDSNVFVTEVPGAFELPMAAKLLALSGTVDAVVCIGVLVKGETMHFEYISEAVSHGIMNVGLQTNTPCVLGVLTCLTDAQVHDRSTGDNNHGISWGKTAVEMAILKNQAMGGKVKAKVEMGFGKVNETVAGGEKGREGTATAGGANKRIAF